MKAIRIRVTEDHIRRGIPRMYQTLNFCAASHPRAIKVKKIEMKTITVRVEQRHIDEGKPKSHFFCPLALALRDKLDNDNVSVGSYIAAIDDKIFTLSRNATRFVKGLDDLRTVRPQTFILRAIE